MSRRVKVLAIIPNHEDCRERAGRVYAMNHPNQPPYEAPWPALRETSSGA